MAIEAITKGNCTGCAACANACPKNAIQMGLDQDGFYKPNVLSVRCIECGICQNICPVNHTKYENNEKPVTYAVMAEDDVRMRSSSGGVFELLANEVLDANGYVCGVAYKDDFTTEHIIIDNKNDLGKLRGSKYVMSDVNLVYRKIKELLLAEKPVLFSGCPCQVAGLNAYLGKLSRSEQLITVDLICHGIPSVKAFQRYLRDVHGNRPMTHVGFKDKEYGWHASMTIDFADGTRFNEPCEKDTYFWSYLTGVNKNKACGSCLFAHIPRQGDLTIGDYWGISNYKKDLNDTKGTSVVLVNNEKAQRFLDKVLPHAKKAEITPLDAAIKGNANLVKSPKNHTSRSQFFKNLDSKRFYSLAPWSYNAERFDVGLVGIPTFPNFGGALTYYALYHALCDMGYSTTIISRPRSSGKPPIMPEKVYEVNPYPANALKLDFKDKDAMFAMNDVCDAFVVGSDQLFNADLYYSFGEIITLDWVTDRHRKVAYAASFGHNFFWGPENQRAKMAHYMQKFDAFSTREEDGVTLAKQSFGVDAEWVLDPVFLCDRSHYEKIAENTARKNTAPHIFGYVLDPDKKKNDILAYCKEQLNLDVDLYSEMLFNPTEAQIQKAASEFNLPLRQAKIDERLYSLIHSDFIVADSFHGICFAIIFEIPFVAILNKNRGASRFYTLLSKLNLTDRLVSSLDELKEKSYLLTQPFDFTESKNLLSAEKERCLAWLKNAISPSNEIKKPFSSVDILNEKIAALKKINRLTDLKMNALLNGKLFMTISQINQYLDCLNANKENLLIAIAVKDTLGFELKEEIANRVLRLGGKISLVDKHWKSYVLVIDGGKTVSEVMSKNEERVAYTGKIQGKAYKIVSRSFRQGNVAAIMIDGVDYAENKRGLNIVVVDKQLNEVVDSVAFDTHAPGIPCYRFGKICQTSLPANVSARQPERTETAHAPVPAQAPVLAQASAPVKKEEPVKNVGPVHGLNTENEVLLHNSFAIAAAGGCTLDYYVDKGIKKIAIYGTDDLVAYLNEQAFYKEIQVTHLLSDKDREFATRLPRPGKIHAVAMESVDLSRLEVPVLVASVRIPPVLLQQRNRISVEKMGDLNLYAHYKHFIFEKVKAYQKQYPELKIAFMNMPTVWDIDQKTEQERHLVPSDPKRNLQQIYETVFRKNGFGNEYIAEVTKLIQATTNNGVNFIVDKKGKYVNAVNGYRVTTDVPTDFISTVYLFGNSVCYGVGTDDEHTIASALQRELNGQYGAHAPYSVLNCSNGARLNCVDQWKSFEYHAPQNGDIAVFIMNYGKLAEEMYQKDFIWCNGKRVLNRPHDMGEIFWDVDHVNAKGYEACGKLLGKTLAEHNALRDREFLIQVQKENVKKITNSNLNLNEAEAEQLEAYLADLRKHKKQTNENQRIGSIVMNCNPFTLGHRYLIEESSKKCDWLYIFVVEENRSVFPFTDRFELVKKGTADLKNVIVIPSGNFIISQTTFQAYFQKEEKKDIVIDASGDINLFAAKIAPTLGISVRFAGEEPLDNITNQYNATMKRILPRFGISFEVISRKESLGAPISASRVRALLAEKNFEEIKQIVPATTYEYLINRFQNSKRILVLGGTRFMGIRLVEKLVEQNHFVTIATRGRNKDSFGKSVSRIVYDRLNPESVKQALSGKHFDIIIDTSAYSSQPVQNVLSCVSCDRYVQVSSVAVYPKHMLNLTEGMFDSSTADFKLSTQEQNYGIGKRYAECTALQSYPQFNPAVVRIPFVVEPENLDNKELNLRLFFYAKHIVNQIPMKVTNPDYSCTFVTTIEEADFLSYLALSDATGVFNFSAEGNVTIKQIIEYIEAKSGCKAVFSDTGDVHPFRAEHFGTVGYSYNLDKAKSIGYDVPKLDSWLWKLLDSYIDLLKKEKEKK